MAAGDVGLRIPSVFSIHNAGDALTAIPLGAAFLLRSDRAERGAGLAVVLTILASALTAGVFAIERIIHPPHPNTSSRSPSPAQSASSATPSPHASGSAAAGA